MDPSSPKLVCELTNRPRGGLRPSLKQEMGSFNIHDTWPCR
jgi:hypothetical protein